MDKPQNYDLTFEMIIYLYLELKSMPFRSVLSDHLQVAMWGWKNRKNL